MRSLHRFLSRWQNIAGLGICLFFIILSVFAPTLAPLPDDQKDQRLFVVPGLKANLPVPPGEQAVLGTVALGVQGRQLDVYSTLIWGTRSALIFGVLTAFSAALIGVLIGSTSAFIGGWGNMLVMRITDAFLAFPVVAAVILFFNLINLLRERSYFSTLNAGLESGSGILVFFDVVSPVWIALILFSWMPYARMTQAMVYRIKDVEFVQAARALGGSSFQIIMKHLIPNSITPAVVMATAQVGGMVLIQAALNFIGLDAGSEWGALLAVGRRWMLGTQGNPFTYWWVFVPITLVLVIFGIGWNLLGDGVNDWLNPKTQEWK